MAELTDKDELRKPSEMFRGKAGLGELKEIADNPHWFAVFEECCRQADAGATDKELEEGLERILSICRK
jgi:hypothetical protein